MANWICVFTIAGLPLYWMFSLVATFVPILTNASPSGSDSVEFVLGLCLSIPVNLAVTILLVAGGTRLRDLRASGSRLVRIGLWVDLASIAIRSVLIIAAVIVTMDSEPAFEKAALDTLVTILSLFLALVVIAFEIASLVWLNQHAASLPLDPSK